MTTQVSISHDTQRHTVLGTKGLIAVERYLSIFGYKPQPVDPQSPATPSPHWPISRYLTADEFQQTARVLCPYCPAAWGHDQWSLAAEVNDLAVVQQGWTSVSHQSCWPLATRADTPTRRAAHAPLLGYLHKYRILHASSKIEVHEIYVYGVIYLLTLGTHESD